LITGVKLGQGLVRFAGIVGLTGIMICEGVVEQAETDRVKATLNAIRGDMLDYLHFTITVHVLYTHSYILKIR